MCAQIIPTTKKTKEELFLELKEIREKEDKLLNKLSYDLNKDKLEEKKLFYEVEHFSFNDFAQIVIGCCVFGLPTFVNTSFWDYLPLISTDLLFYIHCFFIFCVLLALNYEFRNNIIFNKWFLKMLLKRFFFTYFSVFMVVFFILILVNKINYTLLNIDIFRNIMISQSVGLFGAVTFSFLKK